MRGHYHKVASMRVGESGFSSTGTKIDAILDGLPALSEIDGFSELVRWAAQNEDSRIQITAASGPVIFQEGHMKPGFLVRNQALRECEESEQWIPLVDHRGSRVGQDRKLDIHRKGNLHPAFSTYIFDESFNILLQQRAVSKYHSALEWANACSSHPRLDPKTGEIEPIVFSAEKRLPEELGIETLLQLVG
jgi:hypothetical protein